MFGISLSTKPRETVYFSSVIAVCLGWCPKPWGQKLSDFNFSGSAIIFSEYSACSLTAMQLWNLENEVGKAFCVGIFPALIPPAWHYK